MTRNGKQTQRLPLAVDTTAVDLGALRTKEDSPFRYLVKGERPRLDGAFFELLLSRVLLESGGLADFDSEWPRGVQALAGFNLTRLAQLSSAELADMISSVGGEFSSRLEKRADDLQVWADAFWRIRQIYGSFRQYVRSFDTDGHDALVEDLQQRLVGLSPDFLERFLKESGEKPPSTAQPDRGRAPQTKRPRQPQPPAQGQPRPNAQPAEGNRRQQQSRDNAPAKPPATPSQGSDPKAQSADDGKTGSKGRRRRRGFFRRRRGGRGDGASGSSAQPQAAGQA